MDPLQNRFPQLFFVPVLAAGYLMGARRAVLTSVLCVLLVLIYYFFVWAKIDLSAGSQWAALMSAFSQRWNTLLRLAMWGGFLILIGWVFALIQEREVASYNRARELNEELQTQATELREVNAALEESSTQLRQQAEDLHQKGFQIEQLKQKLEETLYSAMDSTIAFSMFRD